MERGWAMNEEWRGRTVCESQRVPATILAVSIKKSP